MSATPPSDSVPPLPTTTATTTATTTTTASARATTSATATVPARAALAGNPSDGHGGAVVATVVGSVAADVTAARSDRFEIAGFGTRDTSIADVVGRVATEGCGEVQPLVPAALTTLHRRLGADIAPVRIEVATTIPRSVGLAGSSAIVIATMRAVARLHASAPWARTIENPSVLAALALAAERDVLGIAAGLQDRVVQSFGGTVTMDFGADAMHDIDEADLVEPEPGDQARSAGDAHDQRASNRRAIDRRAINRPTADGHASNHHVGETPADDRHLADEHSGDRHLGGVHGTRLRVGSYRRLGPLPDGLFVAYRAETAGDSGAVHAGVDPGDPAVRTAMRRAADAAHEAAAAIVAGDAAALGAAMNTTFDQRAAVMELDPRHVEMIEVARANGAAANFTGSGGAVVVLASDGRARPALEELGCRILSL